MRLEGTPLGITLIVASVFMLAFGDAIVKQSSADFSLWQLFVARGLVTVPLIFGIARVTAPASSLWPKAVGWVFVRSMLIVLMWMAYYAALPFMSLSVAATALYTTPLFIALFSAAVIGEPVGARRWFGIVVGFVGVLVILRPAADGFSPVALLPVLAAIFYALAAVITRSKCADEAPLSVAMGLNLCLVLTGAVGVVGVMLLSSTESLTFPFLQSPWMAMSTKTMAIIALLGILLVAESIWVAKAYQIAPAAIIGTFDYSYLVFAVFWGFVFFSDVPDMLTVLGIGLILAAGWLVVRGGSRNEAEVSQP
ncbi:putative membrane protein [Rhizobium sp. SJZ105]|uniref:DMT family transporter n=1 Tax=Rhizobium sp. SJZ105 TaxID=2572678 RepID=UPI0011A88FB1|nr:DMT family transporter [Rhizobium sp. SJZ105]TWC76454.1 putative membrane protein [Rhizobium sp. SJZ105]